MKLECVEALLSPGPTRKEKELDSKVKKPAEAEKYRLEQIAKAQARKVIILTTSSS